MNDNSGISISGGNVNAGAMAAGPHARAVVHQHAGGGDPAEVRALLREVLAELRRLGDDDPRIAEAAEAGRELEEELAGDSPDRGRLRELLARFGETAGTIESLSAAVASIQQAVQPLL